MAVKVSSRNKISAISFQAALCDEAPVVFFSGKDEPVALHWLDELINRYIKEPLRPLNYVKKDAGDISISGLIEILEEFPMLSDRRVVLIKNPDIWEAAEQERLAQYILNASNHNLLVLWMFQHDDNRSGASRGAKTVSKKNGLVKGLEQVIVSRGKVFTATLGRNEKVNWLIDILQHKKLEIKTDTAYAILEYTGDNLLRALTEAEKLALAPSDLYKEPVGENDDNLSFQLLDAIGARNIVEICKILALLWRKKTEPIYLLSTIANHIRLLLQVSKLLKVGFTQKLIADKLKIHPYRITKAAQQCRHYSSDELAGGLEELLLADIKIKTSHMEPPHAVELAVVNLCRK